MYFWYVFVERNRRCKNWIRILWESIVAQPYSFVNEGYLTRERICYWSYYSLYFQVFSSPEFFKKKVSKNRNYDTIFVIFFVIRKYFVLQLILIILFPFFFFNWFQICLIYSFNVNLVNLYVKGIISYHQIMPSIYSFIFLLHVNTHTAIFPFE